MYSDIYITLFTHVLNEEELIIPWLEHHKSLFDHGIILDYGSADQTIPIIRKICPTWEIKKPTESFGACVNDIHLLEERYDGWKIALNVTEFLVIDDLKQFIREFEINNPGYIGIRTRGCILVDKDEHELVDINKPILQQKHYGYFEEDTMSLITPDCTGIKSSDDIKDESELIRKTAAFVKLGIDGRSRLLHKAVRGEYTQGRHATTLKSIYPRSLGVCPESKLLLAWFGYSPFSLYKNRLNRGSRTRYSNFDPQKILIHQQSISYDLLLDYEYNKNYNKLYL